MKTIFAFDDKDHDDINSAMLHAHCRDAYAALWNIQQEIRSYEKYGEIKIEDLIENIKLAILDVTAMEYYI